MRRSDEEAEQAGLVEIALEGADALPAAPVAAFPVTAAAGVEMRREEAVVGVGIRPVAGLAEEAEEVGLRGQVPDSRELQAVQRDVGGVEVDGVDMGRRAGQVGQHVAAARGDGDDAVALAEFHRRDVDVGILPDLRIDQPGEEERKEPLRKAGPGECPVLVDGLADLAVPAKADISCKVGHGANPV